MKNLSSFMLIADDTLKYSLDDKVQKSLKSHLVYSLLFEDRILLSDAQVIGNRNFRQLIRSNDALIESLSPKNFSIGIRDSIDIKTERPGEPEVIKSPSISEVLRGFISWDKCKWPHTAGSGLNKENYKESADLEYIANKAQLKRYSLGDASATYANDVLHLFATDLIKSRIGDDLSSLIYRYADEWQQEHRSSFYPKGGLGIAFFMDFLPKRMVAIQQRNLWDQFSDEVIHIAKSPYLTTLPKILHCNPIYGQAHKEQMELQKGCLCSVERIDDDFWYDSRLRLLEFEEGILRLDANGISYLRESDEFKEFRKRVNHFNGSQESLQLIKDSLFHYKSRIDDLIVNLFPYLKSPRREKREKFQCLSVLNKSSTYGGLALGGLALRSSFPGINELGLGLGIVSYFVSKISEKAENREKRLFEEDKHRIIETLSKEGAPRIDAETSVVSGNQFKTEVFFQSVTE
jgi:hypothetical protein